MNKSDLVDRVAEAADVTKKDAQAAIEATFDTLHKLVKDETKVTLPDLGTFGADTKPERKTYSPHHGKYMMVPKKRVVTFNASKSLKDEVKDVKV